MMNGNDLFGVENALLPDENDELFTPLRAILKELFATPGKGLRGELLILSAGGPQRVAAQPQLHALALGLELLHLATLVHDDLLDESERRRGRPAVWKRWGVKTAVLVGDYLFATAYRMISVVCGPDSMERVNFLLREMVGGELAEEVDKFRLRSIAIWHGSKRKPPASSRSPVNWGALSPPCPGRTGRSWANSAGN